MPYKPRSARNTTIRLDTISVERWLILKENGATRISNTYPSLAADEVAVMLKVTLPREVFKKPTLQATITVPSGMPAKVTPEVCNQMADAIAKGTDFRVEVVAGGGKK